MATSNQPVTADQLISATVKYSNKDDANRVYDISANVNIQNGNVRSFDNGEMHKKENESGNDGEISSYAASFSSYSDRSLNININNASETEGKAILEAIYAFMADVKANVTANPVQA